MQALIRPLARAAGRRAALCSARAQPQSTLVVAAHEGGNLDASTHNVVTAAGALGGDVTVLVAGSDCDAASKAAAAIPGVGNVLVAEDALYDQGIAEEVTNLVLQCQKDKGFTHILAAATNFGKNFIPRLGAKLDVAPLSDVTAINSADSFERPSYAGNAIQVVTSSDPVKVCTVRTTAFDAAPAEGGSGAIEAISSAEPAGLTTFVSNQVEESDRPDLASAGVVVSGGRGLKDEENFKILDGLASKLNAAVGASRAAVDAGFCPNDMQVGQTGKVVAPDLYFAIGISGAIQHLAGMKDSKTIVAINKDPEAPIFQVSDYGLVEDLFKAVPDLEAKV